MALSLSRGGDSGPRGMHVLAGLLGARSGGRLAQEAGEAPRASGYLTIVLGKVQKT